MGWSDADTCKCDAFHLRGSIDQVSEGSSEKRDADSERCIDMTAGGLEALCSGSPSVAFLARSNTMTPGSQNLIMMGRTRSLIFAEGIQWVVDHS
jgi:hypothetical protein